MLFKKSIKCYNVNSCYVESVSPLSKFGFGFVADFSNTWAKAPTFAERTLLLTRVKSDTVRMFGVNLSHGYLSVAILISSIDRKIVTN